MASIFDALAYDNGSIPDSVRRAAQGELDYQKAIRNKLPLATEGSGIPESVRKAAQAALEKGAAPVAPPVSAAVVEAATGNPWMQGVKSLPEGLLSKGLGAAGRALGPLAAGYDGVNVLNEKFGPAAYDNIKVAVEEGQTRKAMQEDPELANRGQETVNRISGNAMQGVSGLLPQYQEREAPAPQGLTEEELNAQNPNDAPPQGFFSEPQQSPMEPTPVGPVAQAAPTTVPQAAAKTVQEQETQRQAIEQGAIKGLSTGVVSRPELAAEIVKSDAQKSGTVLTPDQFKKATAVELTNMKSMDNKDVSRYISYALMAAGVLATVFDKSGKAGDAFSASFNKQLDRNLAAGLQTQKANAAAAKQAQDLQIALAGLNIKSRQADTQEKSVEQTGRYQEGTLDQRRDAAEGALKLGYDRIGAANARSGQSMSLRQQQMAQSERHFQSLFGLRQEDQQLRRDQFATDQDFKNARIRQGNEKLLIDSREAAAKGKPKGISTDSKVAGEVVEQVLDSQGLNASSSAKTALAEAYRYEVQNNPAAAADPIGTVKRLASQSGIVNKPAAYFGNGTTAIRRPKE